ncbi:DnaJ sub B member 14 [Kappamyces sp. JEL0829]|nr:DnaJ sub B member 14 [Kappamyces sp. JEL0829]
MSQMNRDEAEKCLNLSKKKHKMGDSEAALKFALKSVKLCETLDGKAWLSFLESAPTSSKPELRKSKSSPAMPKKEEDAPKRPFTPDQVKGIKSILDSKKKGDLYGIFGLEKSCSDNEIKKAYRKMALLYHPDKCGAPGTDEAFKAIGHAWTVLSDADKRTNYDRYGIDSESSRGGGGGGNPFQNAGFQGFGGHPGFEGEISPEDLLRMFMGGGAFGGPQFTFHTNRGFRTNFRQQQRQAGGEQENRTMGSTILQLLPIIILFFLSTLSFFTAEDEPFSFHPSHDYSLGKSTAKHHVQYFVNHKNYERRFNTVRRQAELEARVEADYLQHIRVRCNQERETKAYYIRQASSWFSVDKDKLERAQTMEMRACDELNLWYRT